MKTKKILEFALGSIGSALLGFITVPITAWLFPVEHIGKLAILQIALTLSILLFSLGMDQSLVRYYYESNNKSQTIKNAMLPGVIFLFAFLAFSIFFSDNLSSIIFDEPNILYGLLILLLIVASYFLRFFSLILRLEEKGLAYSFSQIIPKLLLIILIGIVSLSSKNDFSTYLAINAISIVFTALIFMFFLRHELVATFRCKASWPEIKEMFRFAMPLLLGSLTYFTLSASDRFFLKIYASYSELGIYSLAFSFASGAAILQGIFGIIWPPMIYKMHSQGGLTLQFVQKSKRVAVLIVAIIFGMAGILSWLVDFLIPHKYYEVKYLIISCLGLPVFYTLSEVTGLGIGITKKTSYYLIASFLSLLAAIFLNGHLIPIYGAAGAAASICCSLWLFFVLKTEFSNIIWLKTSRFDTYFMPTLGMLFAIAMTLKFFPIETFRIIWAGYLLLSLLLFRAEFVSIYKYIKYHINHKRG